MRLIKLLWMTISYLRCYKIETMPKLFHAHKSNLFLPLVLLPVCLWVAYEEIIRSNFLHAIMTIAFWFFIMLFAVNYWFQAIVVFIGAFVAFYFRNWGVGVLLLLLSAYLVNAARIVEHGELENLGELREKSPMAGQIFGLLQDKKKINILVIILTIVFMTIGYFMKQYVQAP